MTTMRRALLLGAAALAAGGSHAGPAGAQDIEELARVRGITLPRAYYERVRQDPDFFELKRGWRSRTAASGPAVMGGLRAAVLPGTGEMGMVVVMTLFSDSPPAPFSVDITQQRLFGANPLGSLTDFYTEISGGRVTLTGSVLPWVRTGITRAATVGASMGLGDDARVGDYLIDALGRVDATVNFAQYDNNGPDGIPNSGDDDGYVDVVVFQYSDIDASCGGTGPWPHRSSVRGQTQGTAFSTNDLRPNGTPVMVDDYIMQSARSCDGSVQQIPTIAHETGHAFGLPDFYDPSGGILPAQRRWVLGCWTLMAAGSWGCGDAASQGKPPRPSHMGAYEKQQLGWIDETDAGNATNQFFTLLPVQTSGRSLRVPLRDADEYLLLEYRPNTGYDFGLPAGGVLVYHVEPARPMRPCPTCERLYRVGLVEADGDSTLVKNAAEGGNRGEAGDIFTGTRFLNDGTTPSIRLNSGAPSAVALSITVAGGQAQIGVFRRPAVSGNVLLGPYLGTAAPTADQQTALDALGNGNGRYDLGDARAYLRSGAAGAQ
jgi:M6 family metalloprotease-like protein